jgi:hypothetical protein
LALWVKALMVATEMPQPHQVLVLVVVAVLLLLVPQARVLSAVLAVLVPM